MLWTSLILVQCAAIAVVCASPFVLMEKYIDEYQHGIDELKKLSEHYEIVEESFDPSLYNETEAIKETTEYDFIIIGGGTSGSVLANRLSEVPEWKILLLEAGAEETPITQIPKLSNYLLHSPYTWGHSSIPQKTSCLGSHHQKCVLPTGKILGGSSATNNMIFTRGNHRDYDLWSDHSNSLGWCWNHVAPLFKKMEDAHLTHMDRKFHHFGGPLHLENPQYSSHLKSHILAAAKEQQIPIVDYNGKEQVGLGVVQGTTKSGHRNSAAQAYLEEAKTRNNLIIHFLSHVVEIVVSHHTKEATGVKFIHDGKLHYVKASKEIILAAGAINTPQLLLLSGIGPKETLEKLEIHPVADLPVGLHLRDHPEFLGLSYVFNKTADIDADKNHDEKTTLAEYLKSGEGPLASLESDVIAFVKTKHSKEKSNIPDVELLFKPELLNKGPGHLKHLGITPETYDSVWKPIEGHTGITVTVTPIKPKSHGSVTLKDQDPLHFPLIDLNHLSDEEEHDLDTTLAGIRSAQHILQSESLQKLGLHINQHQVHGCDTEKFDSDEYWKCAIRHLTVSRRDLSGSAQMGVETDKTAVVNNILEVHGVQKLRVADASVIPVSISGNIMAATYLVGEKAAELIKEHWKTVLAKEHFANAFKVETN